jgi:diguanylate cyclase (GGDEF)-like protein
LDDPNGKPLGYVLVLTDITLLKKRAEIDPLTGVYNREGLTNAFTDFQKFPDSHFSVSAMIIDLDRFKNINDTYGHFAGDNVLLDFVKAAQFVLSGNFTLGRLGGDEFVVLLPAEIQEAFDISEKLRKCVAERNLRYLNNDIPYTVSIGVASCNIQDVSLSALLDKADQALYKAKQQGKNRTSM